MSLRPFQERVKTHIATGRSVILQAPTGSGKTRAALAEFIESFYSEAATDFPRKCIYTVPMRVLAHQFVNEYAEYAASYQRRFQREMKVRIQTGDQRDDPRFEGDLIFCTIDQFLSGYFSMPYGLPHRLANLNAGAAVGSYIVCDEFHLLDPGSTLPSTLFALRQLSKLAPVLLMTATFSETMLHELATWLHAEVELVPPEEARDIETRNGKVATRERIWQTSDHAMDASAVLAAHQQRSLVLCNTVKRAQALYRELCDSAAVQAHQIEVRLLHSRFLPEDRRETETWLQTNFGKTADHAAGSKILVSTQAIEVGVDVTCEQLHTEAAPASSLIQRAGRCARYAGEKGTVTVYPVGNPPYPYTEKQGEQVTAAYEWIKAHTESVFDFAQEQALVNAVATPRDQSILQTLRDGSVRHQEEIYRVLRGDGQTGDNRLLVRDADSRLVLVHPQPDALLSNPLAATGFSLPINTLLGACNEWLKREMPTTESTLFADDEPAWRIYKLIEEDNDEEGRTRYEWKPLLNASEVFSTRAVVVNPVLAGYLKDEGFVTDQGNTAFVSATPSEKAPKSWESTIYQLESYQTHIRLVLDAFKELALPELHMPARRLAHAAGWPDNSVLDAAWLVCLLHDVGKLDTKWQLWAHDYQQRIQEAMPKGMMAAAHTHHDGANPLHKAAQNAAQPKRPNHAGESAWACAHMLRQTLEKPALVRAALTAIARHHTPFAKECGGFELAHGADALIQATADRVPKELGAALALSALTRKAQSQQLNGFASCLIGPEDEFGWLAYLLLVRALRRADQRGTERGTKQK